MTSHEITSQLCAVAEELRQSGIHAAWFFFGSYLRSPESSNDIDVLVIYLVPEHAVAIRNRLSSLFILPPLHLLLATPTEERELDLIWNQGCVPFFPT